MTELLISTPRYRWLRLCLTDCLLFALICLIPALSHLTRIPFYLIEPMRICFMTGILFTRSKPNVVFLAFALPLLSYLTSGHPLLLKAFLMSAELAVNALLFFYLHDTRRVGAFFSTLLSIVVGKGLYYLIKYLLISFALFEGSLVSTSLTCQLVVTLAISLLFAFFYDKRERNETLC